MSGVSSALLMLSSCSTVGYNHAMSPAPCGRLCFLSVVYRHRHSELNNWYFKVFVYLSVAALLSRTVASWLLCLTQFRFLHVLEHKGTIHFKLVCKRIFFPSIFELAAFLR